MHIGDLARKAGIAPSAIRYYEAAGLLPHPARHSGRRVYDEDALTRLELIALAQSAGFTLKEISEVARAPGQKGWRPAKFDALVERKIAEVDAKLEQLGAMRKFLETSKACGCVSLDDCKIYAEARDVKRARPNRARV